MFVRCGRAEDSVVLEVVDRGVSGHARAKAAIVACLRWRLTEGRESADAGALDASQLLWVWSVFTRRGGASFPAPPQPRWCRQREKRRRFPDAPAYSVIVAEGSLLPHERRCVQYNMQLVPLGWVW